MKARLQQFPCIRPGRRARHRLGAGALTLALGALLASVPQAQAAPREQAAAAERYVALGDSYTSGPRLGTQVDSACGRSDVNYPSLVARALTPASFTDVSCSGADTTHMTGPQGEAPPQLDALAPDTTLVTLGIGGNDLDLPALLGRCIVLGALLPYGAPCKTSYTLHGTDEVTARIDGVAPKVDAVLDEIHRRSPRARVLLVGYPVILPEDGGNCHGTVSLSSGDAPWIRDKEKQFNEMLARSAALHGARYVDTYTPSVGHDLCKPAGTRWVEPADSDTTAGLHPNEAGHRSAAAAVLAATGG
ncbi:SGNH/GDSL hydrolase family protein [Streptomyces sp. NPDC007088]|uniref:SGNH/GDSL hydrolase family protein n=1 Tax=Streptomyces sp. NPDC007088 TaxID=3364773 RepID=UPI003688DD02